MPDLKPIAWVPLKVSLLLYRKKEMLSKREERLRYELQNKSPEIKTAAALSHKFLDMMEQGRPPANRVDR